MRIDLNNKLTIRTKKNDDKEKFIDGLSESKSNYSTRQTSYPLDPVRNSLSDGIYHNNYLEYLESAWASHYGIVISPDIVWHTLLNEVTLIIAENVELFRDLFTDSPDKKEISVYSNDLEILPLESIADELRKLVPGKFANTFLDGFTTSTAESQFVRSASFADCVSPYYNYSMFCCGIPFVEILGDSQDWDDIFIRWQDIAQKILFPAQLSPYHVKVNKALDNFSSPNMENFRNMFSVERCGSGSDREVFGWFTDLFRIQPKGLRKSSNFSTHIAKVNYKHLNTGKEYLMKAGILSSSIQEDLLVPNFNYIVYEKLKEPKIIPYDPYAVTSPRERL